MPTRRAAARALCTGAALATVAVLVPAPPAAAEALPLSVSDQAVHDRLSFRSLRADLGDDLAGLVVDAATGQVLWRRSAGEGQIPASNTKILTAVTTLETFGPDHRFTTRVVAGSTPRNVVLVGGGDPSLTHRQLGRLARTVATDLAAQGRTRVSVQVDDSLFPAPSLAYGWRASYQIGSVSPVRALVVDQHRRWDTSLDAGQVFARKLEKWGTRVRSVRRAVAAADATVLAAIRGRTVGRQVAAMMQESDNDVAEVLHRMVAVQTGHPATWDGARDAQRAALERLGVSLSRGVYDGSGLSRRNRLTPRDVVAVLATIVDGTHPHLLGLQAGSFPLAGVSGTLGPHYRRYVTYPTRCAAGLVQGKTGSLSGVITLSGLARGADGQLKLYSFLLNHVPDTLTTRRAVDRLATTVTGCW